MEPTAPSRRARRPVGCIGDRRCPSIPGRRTSLLKSGQPTPIKPVGADGKPLNLDFEDGTLKDWTATGDAFKGQPVKGDTVSPRRSDMKSGHQGNYWIGGFEVAGDDGTGTLTSVPFKVTHRWASFLVAGGPWPKTRVELVNAADKQGLLQGQRLRERGAAAGRDRPPAAARQ